MPAGLLGHTVACVDEDHRDVGRGGAGRHVARVLHVTRAVGDDESPQRRRERPVRHVDRDALLALGAQPVGQQGQVDVAVTTTFADLLDVLQLVGHDLLAVVQQAPDQGALAIVDRSARHQSAEVNVIDHNGTQK